MSVRPAAAGSPRRPGRWNIANGLTILRIALVPPFGWLLVSAGDEDTEHHTALRLAAFGLFAVAALTDKADGALARRYGLVTDFGRLADPLADKALIGTALVVLSVLGEVPWWMTIVIMTRELGITVLRYWVRRFAVISASAGGKLKTVLQVVAIAFLVLPLTGWVHTAALMVLGVALLVTVVTGVDYIGRALRARRGTADGGR